jgi:hypothetical protein
MFFGRLNFVPQSFFFGSRQGPEKLRRKGEGKGKTVFSLSGPFRGRLKEWGSLGSFSTSESVKCCDLLRSFSELTPILSPI